MAATGMRHVRVPDELWAAALAASKARGETVSEAVRGFLGDYVAENLPGYTSGFVAGADAAKRAAPKPGVHSA